MFSLKVLVIGHKQHGKGTFAKIATERFGIPSMGTSRFATLHMFNLMKDEHGYLTPEACYEDRGNHREFWFTELRRYNDINLSQLIEDIYLKHPIAEGLRNREEFEEVKRKKIVDLIVWIDAAERKPLEDAQSMELTRDDAHVIIDNNTTEAEFIERVVAFLTVLTGQGNA